MNIRIFLILSQCFLLSLSLLQDCYKTQNSTEPDLNYFEKFGKSLDKKLRPADDVSVIQDFSFKFKFFNRFYPYVYITNNGICYFDNSNAINHPSIKPFPIKGINKAMIAPFWSDIDTRVSGEIFYKIRNDDATLKKIGCEIQSAFKTFVNFKPFYALVVTWNKVRSYENRLTSSVTNTFQLVMATNGFYSFLIFNYADLNWPNVNSRERFVAGFNSADGSIYQMIADSLSKNSSYLSTNSNVGLPSKWIFRVDSIEEEIENFVPFGTKMEDKLLEKSDESHSPPIGLKQPIRITDKLTVYSIFVYANGFITFNSPFIETSAVPKTIPIQDMSLIFPFWSDINILNGGDIFYREITDQESIFEINTDIGNNFNATWAFVATYFKVAPHGLINELENTFQLVLASNQKEFYAILNYDKLTWPNSYFKQSYQCGFSLDMDHYHLISHIDLRKNSNVNVSGKYVFRLDKPSRIIEFEGLTNDNQDKNSNYKPIMVLIILIILIGINSAFNSFCIIWKYLNRKKCTAQTNIIYTKKLSDSTTILMREEQCE